MHLGVNSRQLGHRIDPEDENHLARPERRLTRGAQRCQVADPDPAEPPYERGKLHHPRGEHWKAKTDYDEAVQRDAFLAKPGYYDE